MALSAALRRVAAAAPVAIRAAQPFHRSAPILRALLPLGPTPASCLARFSSSASSLAARKPDSDKDLIVVINSEIKCAEETVGDGRVMLQNFYPFRGVDVRGTTTVTLWRRYQGEDIEITVSMPSLVTGNEPEQADENEDDNATPADFSLPLTVVVTKGDGTGLEFTCTGYPDALNIHSVSVKQKKDSDEEMIAYEGPDFANLDKNLQKAFRKYLEMRGVKPTNYWIEYMIKKDSREYLFWLECLKHFMQK